MKYLSTLIVGALALTGCQSTQEPSKSYHSGDVVTVEMKYQLSQEPERKYTGYILPESGDGVNFSSGRENAYLVYSGLNRHMKEKLDVVEYNAATDSYDTGISLDVDPVGVNRSALEVRLTILNADAVKPRIHPTGYSEELTTHTHEKRFAVSLDEITNVPLCLSHAFPSYSICFSL